MSHYISFMYQCASSKVVRNDPRTLRSVVQDFTDFLYLHHEHGTPKHQIIRSAHAHNTFANGQRVKIYTGTAPRTIQLVLAVSTYRQRWELSELSLLVWFITLSTKCNVIAHEGLKLRRQNWATQVALAECWVSV